MNFSRKGAADTISAVLQCVDIVAENGSFRADCHRLPEMSSP